MPKNTTTKRRTKYKSSESESSESEHEYSQSDHSESESDSYRSEESSSRGRSKSSESDRSHHKVQKKPIKPKHKEEKPKASRQNKTSYQLFCDKERKKLAKEHPSWKLSEMSKELGKRWNALDDKKKRAFARKAAKAKEGSD